MATSIIHQFSSCRSFVFRATMQAKPPYATVCITCMKILLLDFEDCEPIIRLLCIGIPTKNPSLSKIQRNQDHDIRRNEIKGEKVVKFC